MTLGVGQFCTSPGLIVAIRSAALDLFLASLASGVEARPSAIMLHEGLKKNFLDELNRLRELDRVSPLADTLPEPDGCQVTPVLLQTDARNLLNNPQIAKEVFGPAAMIVVCDSTDELFAVAESLAECGKIPNSGRDLAAAVKKIQNAGIEVMGGFIVGFDSDTPSIFQRQIDFIQQSGIVTAMVGMLQAPPGTRLFDRLVGERRVCTNFSGDNVDGRTNIIPAMGLDRLIDGYRAIMRQIYSPGKYYQRIRSILKELKLPVATVPIDWQRFLAFFRACLRLGVLGKERFQYWYLLIWTLARRPRLLPLAVTLSIYGYHYRRICELHIL